MGRPLFSSQYATTTPTVRVEPEQTQTCEKWTYWNPFDPDSEEFFANAEVETPVSLVPGDDSQSPTPVMVEVESSSSSDSDSSGRGSPTQEALEEENISVEELDSRIRQGVPIARRRRLSISGLPESAYTYRATTDRVSHTVAPPSPTYHTPTTPPSMPTTTSYIRTGHYTDVPVPSRSPSPDYFDWAASVPVPIAMPMRVTRRARPSTPPPAVSQSLRPSPPPSVTPRLYTWSGARAAAPPSSPTPAPTVVARSRVPIHASHFPIYPLADAHSPPVASTPLPNLGARMSVAHIAPSITSGRIRV